MLQCSKNRCTIETLKTVTRRHDMFTSYTQTANYLIDAATTANKDLVRKAVTHDTAAKTLNDTLDQQATLAKSLVKGMDSLLTDGGKELNAVLTKELTKFWADSFSKMTKTTVC